MTNSVRETHEISSALRESLLRSEKKRVIAVISFVSFFFVLAFVRIFLFGSAMSHWGLFIAALLVVWELGLLRRVNQVLKSGQEISHFVWYLTSALEASFPTIGVAFLTSSRLATEYRPLATPWVLAYFPFILLSVLRLSPRLSWVTGALSACGYLWAAYSEGWHFNPGTNGFGATQTAVPYFALLILVTGFLAAGVSAEMRTHVEAALREAKTRHKLEQVEHDLQIARSVQQSLLPKARPQIAGFQVAGWNQSADDTGGDFYDWRRLPDGRWIVVLADVTGHGIGPAILASVCRAYSRASFNVRDNLEVALKNINQSFTADLTPGRFATFVAAVFQEGSEQVELLSAGHGPLFVYSANSQSFHLLNAQVVPLGIIEEWDEAVPVKINMDPGDIVLLITDGFLEWENVDGEEYGCERLTEVVRRFSDREPEVIIAELYDSVVKFARGTPQKDDLTTVLIKRVPSEAMRGESQPGSQLITDRTL